MRRYFQNGLWMLVVIALAVTGLGRVTLEQTEAEIEARVAKEARTELVGSGVIEGIAHPPKPYGLKSYICKLDKRPERHPLYEIVRVWSVVDIPIGNRVAVSIYSFSNSAGDEGRFLWAESRPIYPSEKE